MELTHLKQDGSVNMVDISSKYSSYREATAQGKIYMSKECFLEVVKGNMKKGDVLTVAKVAAIMAIKKTDEIIPLCHQIDIAKIDVNFTLNEEEYSIICVTTVKTNAKTGVEMEALLGVEIGLIAIYDMCKALDKSMKITDICLQRKIGGKSGEYLNESI